MRALFSIGAGAALLALGGCLPPTSLPLEAELVAVSVETVVLEVQTKPGATVTHKDSGLSQRADDTGLARFEIPTKDAGSGSSAGFQVEEESFFGQGGFGVGHVELGFSPSELAKHPAPADRSWAWGVKNGGGGQYECLTLFDYVGEPAALHLPGSGIPVALGGVTWVGPPGTTISLGGVAIEVAESGFVRWDPSPQELLALFRTSALVQLPTSVTTPGRAPATGEISLNSRSHCEKRLGAYLREVFAGEATLPPTEAEPVPAAVFPRLDGSLVAIHPKGKWRSGQGLLAKGREFQQLEYWVLEEEVARRPAAEECASEYYEVVMVNKNMEEQSRGVETTDIRPTLATVRVTLRHRNGTELGAKEFEPPSSYACAELVYADSLEIETWVAGLLPEHRPRRR